MSKALVLTDPPARTAIRDSDAITSITAPSTVRNTPRSNSAAVASSNVSSGYSVT